MAADTPTADDVVRFAKEHLGVELAPWQIEFARRWFADLDRRQPPTTNPKKRKTRHAHHHG